MAQKYIEGDIVEYENKVMAIKEPRDGSHFDLSCPQEGLVYCLVDVDEIKPVNLTPAMLEKNGWKEVKGNYFCPDCYLISQIGINRDTDDNQPDEYYDSVEEDYHSLIDDDYMEMWQRIREENGDSII